ncbi:MAG: pyridoxal-phosphate dependent enzyme [Bacteroidales bacterium]|jgi:threonine dehydratase|nr:pyridoxal-phosphate dependent enzyme [Bacteroidales bacterium]
MLKDELIECHNRIKPYIHNTPVLSSQQLNSISGTELLFKCENFQRMGAFKMRGATNAILQLTDEQKSRGVVTHSSGNFAQALALAAKSVGVKAYIVMPANAPKVKKDAVKGYEGIIVECEPTLKARMDSAAKIEQERGATFIHPSNNIDVILGQGTACKELIDLHTDLDIVITPVGGGGLIAGTALAAANSGRDITIVGAEPFEVDDAYRSLISGKIETNRTTNTIADGLKTELGDINFPIIKRYVSTIIRVTEPEIVSAMHLIWERMKIVVESSSAVAMAAILKNGNLFKGKKTGVILSGGNVDLSKLPF